MKGSVIASLSLDVSAIAFMLIPAEKFHRFSTSAKTIGFTKRAVFFLLLISGFLIDRYISHAGH
jgi:hypothetical protein